MNKKLHINILTYCDAIKNPERFEMLKKSVSSLSGLKNKNVFISLWDNGSSEGVISFIKSLNFIDYVYYSNKNLFDVAPIRALLKSSEIIGNSFVCHMEDDLQLIKHGCIESILDYLEKNKDVSGMRLTKFDVYNMEIYDKSKQIPETDLSNMMSIFNAVDENQLVFEGPTKYGDIDFFKCNWHWYNFPIIAKIEDFKKIVPYGDMEPLQYQETIMRNNFHKLGKKLSILNGGVVTHLGTFDSAGSMRLFVRDTLGKNYNESIANGQFPTLDNIEVNAEVERFIFGLKKCLSQN